MRDGGEEGESRCAVCWVVTQRRSCSLEIRRKLGPQKTVFVEELVESLVNVCDYRPLKRHGEVLRLYDTAGTVLVNGTDGEGYGTFFIFYDPHDCVQSLPYESSRGVGILIDGCHDGCSRILLVAGALWSWGVALCYSTQFMNRRQGNGVLESGEKVTHVTSVSESKG